MDGSDSYPARRMTEKPLRLLVVDDETSCSGRQRVACQLDSRSSFVAVDAGPRVSGGGAAGRRLIDCRCQKWRLTCFAIRTADPHCQRSHDGNATPDTASRRQAGALDYLTKPFDIARLQGC